MPASNDDFNLRDTLNRLAQKNTTITEREEARNDLAAYAKTFNGASTPAAQQLADALPNITDYGSRWITAKLLRDAAVKDAKVLGGNTTAIILGAFATDTDAGMRYMAAGLIRDIGLAHSSQTVNAAGAISMLLGRETDDYARGYQKGAILQLGLASEAAAPLAVDAIGQLILNEKDSFARVDYAQNLGQLGTKHASQSTAAVKQLQQAAANETDGFAAHKIAENITNIALYNVSSFTAALEALANGFAKGGRIEALSGNANGLARLSEKHPAAVAVVIENQLDGASTRDQRRLSILNLKHIAALDTVGANIAAPILLNALSQETDPLYRRHIVDGLLTATTNRADAAPVLDALKTQQQSEKDPETRDAIDHAMRRLGYVRPYTPNVLKLQPQPQF
ncbi:MAG: hypothetical protein K0R10_692 [Alphaproteobacteria bacterium]|jgi:hypothetical protein|nr:hypothetical protein [Alphaproteobacteria bacterium]